MEPLLEVKNLKTYFKINKEWVPAVEEVNFHIDQGETLGIVGGIRLWKKRNLHVDYAFAAKSYK